MTPPLPMRRFLPAALILAGAGLAAACTTSSLAEEATSAPFACQISIDESSHGTTFQGVVQSSESLSGSYSFALAGRGANIRQGGAFTARSGQTVTLGQSMLSGPASAYDVELSLSVDGQTYRCPGVETDI